MIKKKSNETSQLKCFVAMAFGNEQTDLLYEKQIKAALRETQCQPFRIDKKEHNRNINDVIMEELAVCDFVIADLTFARPSVYFEAGFAESRVPVIYTARGDHFRARDDDEHGNVRVHFDVSMRNIVAWKSITDERFRARLTARIRHVTQPIRRRLQRNEALEVERRQFTALSANEKAELLGSVGARVVSRFGYEVWPRVVEGVDLWLSRLDDFRFLVAQTGTMLKIVSMFSQFNITSGQLVSVLSGLRRARVLAEVMMKVGTLRKWRKVSQVDQSIYFCTPHKSPMTSLRKHLDHVRATEDGETLLLRDAILRLRNEYGTDEHQLPLKSTFSIIADIKSVSEFEKTLRSKFGK